MKLVTTVFLILLLGACAKTIGPDNYATRISSTQLDSNEFRVSYRGSTTGGNQQAVDLTLLASAEEALRQGFNYFVIVTTSESAKTTTFTTPENSSGQVANDLDSSDYPPTLDGNKRYVHIDPGLTNTIICFKQRPEGFAYAALILKATLRGKYQLDALAG